MTAQRSRKEELHYRRHQADLKKIQKTNQSCAFCIINSNSSQFIEETKNFRVIKNIFPYSIWDGELVDSHLMVIPKRHTDKLGSLPLSAGNEFLRLIDKYENTGYNLYARSPGSKIKTVFHQHSHLIRPLGKRRKFILFAKKPYIRISF